MRILLLTFYFPPDLSAGSFRSSAIADALARLAPAGTTIDVITTLPNRYQSFTADAPATETRGPISIERIALKKHRSGMLDQSMSFASFAKGARRAVRNRRYDVVFATSGRLMTAVLGTWIARRKGARLYLDIRDIFVDNLRYIVPKPASAVLRPVFSALERWAVSGARKVNLVSGGFAPHFEGRYAGRQFTYFTNAVDDEFVGEALRLASRAPGPVTVVYAGNIGEGQGLENIIPPLAARLGPEVRFRVIGDGGRRRQLEAAVHARGLTNVELVLPMNRQRLVEEYRAADVLFLHLNDYECFKAVLPSKLFEYAASGKPVWAGVGGYTAEFVRSEIQNSAVFPPCDVEAALSAFAGLRLEQTPRREFVDKYARGAISSNIAREVLSLTEST